MYLQGPVAHGVVQVFIVGRTLLPRSEALGLWPGGAKLKWGLANVRRSLHSWRMHADVANVPLASLAAQPNTHTDF